MLWPLVSVGNVAGWLMERHKRSQGCGDNELFVSLRKDEY